jgi:hypothetical protein
MENQNDVVDLLQIRGYIRKVKKKKNKSANRKLKQKLRTFWWNDFKKECLVFLYMFCSVNTYVSMYKHA